jgi:cob(I)alamin adenosyltransferase
MRSRTDDAVLDTTEQVHHGYVHVYTGDGKGKTTAALGLAMRAAGAGLRVFIAQFAKGTYSSELRSFARLSDQITFRQYGSASLVRKRPGRGDVAMACDALRDVRTAVQSGEYSLVILDEANIATMFGMISVEALLEIIDTRPDSVELVLTGRGADRRIVERADLVTEMREIRHYYHRGIMARTGIEI